MSRPRIKLPKKVSRNEVIEVKALVRHVMETGNRKDAEGNPIPRNIIHTFTAHFEGELVFHASLGPSISANPYISFFMRVPGPGTFTMTWIDDVGSIITEHAKLNVVWPVHDDRTDETSASNTVGTNIRAQ